MWIPQRFQPMEDRLGVEIGYIVCDYAFGHYISETWDLELEVVRYDGYHQDLEFIKSDYITDRLRRWKAGPQVITTGADNWFFWLACNGGYGSGMAGGAFCCSKIIKRTLDCLNPIECTCSPFSNMLKDVE